MDQQRQSVTSQTSTLSQDEKPPIDKKARRGSKIKLKFKRKKKAEIDEVSPFQTNEHTPLVFHATYKKPSEEEANLEEAKRTMYVSHLVAKFSELGWQFCLILFLTALTNYKSLTLVATYGLFTGLVVCLSGPSAGAMIDNKERDRLSIAKFFIWIENLSVVIATTCCYFLLRSVPANDDENFIVKSKIIPDLAPPATMTTWLLIIGLHVFGAFGKLTDQSMTVALERDWIVVMSKVSRGDHDINSNDSEDSERMIQSSNSQESDVSSLSVGNASLGSHTDLNNQIVHDLKEKTWLTQTNTVMKQIDLVCKVAAPAAAGIFFAFFDNYKAGDEIISKAHWDNLSYAATIIGLLNLMSLFVENSFIQHIYELVPLLSVRNSGSKNIPKVISKTRFSIPDGDSYKTDKMRGNKTKRGVGGFRLSTIQSGITRLPSSKAKWDPHSGDDDRSNFQHGCEPFSLPRGLGIYINQTIAFGGFALSLLYLNVLSFGALMTAYLVFKGMSYQTIGILRGVSSVIGLMGTFAYRISSRRNSLSYTGAWSIIFQFSCLILCYVSLFVTNDKLSLALLIIGVIASRIGLWVFDLTITQLMQQMIPEDVRGIVGGVQKSLNGFFDLATYGLGLVYSNPEDFHVLVATGFGSVGLAMCIYVWGTKKYMREIASS